MLGYVEFPRIRTVAYPLTVGPYGFLWLELQPSPEPVARLDEAGEPELQISGATDWMSILEGNGRRELEESILQGYLARQRWFGGKSRPITGTRIEDWAIFNQGASALALVEVQYAEGECDTYLVTLGLLFGKAADALREESPNALLARVITVADEGVLHEAVFNDSASEALLALITGGRPDFLTRGRLLGVPSSALAQLKGPSREVPRRGSAEQSNTSIIFGDKLIMKLFRRQQWVQTPTPRSEVTLPIDSLHPHRALWRFYPVHPQRAGAIDAGHVARPGHERRRWMELDPRRVGPLLRGQRGAQFSQGGVADGQPGLSS